MHKNISATRYVLLGLGAFAGMREGDMISLNWHAYDGAAVHWVASKNGERCIAPVTAGSRGSISIGRYMTWVCQPATTKAETAGFPPSRSFRTAASGQVRCRGAVRN